MPVLRRANADVEGVRKRANAVLDELPTVTGDAYALARPSTSATIELLKSADEEARGLGDEYVSTLSICCSRSPPTR